MNRMMNNLMTAGALAIAVSLASCSSNDDNEMRVNPDGSVRFTAATQAAADLLWAKADNGGAGYTKAADLTVGLNFRHCLAKLTMKCKADDSVGSFDPADVAVCIKNAQCFSFTDISTGYTGFNPNTPTKDDIIPRPWDTPAAGCFATYDALVPPAAYTSGEMSVEFHIGADTYTWSVDAVTFGSGKEHIYEVLLTRTGIRVTGTIEDWTTVQGGNVTAE